MVCHVAHGDKCALCGTLGAGGGIQQAAGSRAPAPSAYFSYEPKTVVKIKVKKKIKRTEAGEGQYPGQGCAAPLGTVWCTVPTALRSVSSAAVQGVGAVGCG